MEGVRKLENKIQPLPISRRNFMAWGGTAVLVAATGPSIYKQWPEGEMPVEPKAISEEGSITEEIVVEKIPITSEAFGRSVNKYQTLQTLDRASVFFTTDDDTIVGDPVLFQDFDVPQGTRINKDGVEEPFIYKFTPAAKDTVTEQYVVDTIPPEWTDHVKELHAAQYGVTAEELEQQHVTADFVAALKQKDEPELVAAIEAGTIRTKLDIVKYFIAKDFEGSNGDNRVEYIQNQLTFSGNLDKAPSVTAALRELIPSLVAVESGFDDGVENKSTGAKSSFQFVENTWHDELKRTKFVANENLPFTEQVAAAGELFSKMYDRLQYWCYEEQNYQGRNYLEDIKALFPSQEYFEKYFLVPCLLNAYNTGEQGMGEVIVAYAQSKEFFAHMKAGGVNGYDFFHEMTAWAATSELSQLQDYRGKASTYTQQIYATAPLLNDVSLSQTSRVAQLK